MVSLVGYDLWVWLFLDIFYSILVIASWKYMLSQHLAIGRVRSPETGILMSIDIALFFWWRIKLKLCLPGSWFVYSEFVWETLFIIGRL